MLMLKRQCSMRTNRQLSHAQLPRLSSTAQLRSRRALPVLASSYTQPALQAIRCAQEQACRQGSMFVAPTHLLLGLLEPPANEASKLLGAAGLTPEAAELALVDPDLLSSSSSSGSMASGDFYWAPDTRLALETAAQTAQQQGLVAAGTPHLLLGLLACSNAAVTSLLSKTGIQVETFAASVHEAAGSCMEPPGPGQLAGGDAAAAQLVQQYQQYIARHGSAAPTDSTPGSTSFGAANVGQQSRSGGGTAASPSPWVRTPEDEDIYE